MTVELIWGKIPMSLMELSLSKVLRCGQAFRWKNVNNIWSIGMKDRVIFVKQDESYLYYSSLLKNSSNNSGSKMSLSQIEDTKEFVMDYFNLNVNLVELYEYWTLQHGNFMSGSKGKKVNKDVATPFSQFKGIRMLHQDPWETTISFICSSNNNVKRISKMCDNLCSEFGEYIESYEGIDYYSFPSAETLAKSPDVETKLRTLGFGYRAKYIYQTALKLTKEGLSIEELEDLRNKTYEEAHNYLLQLSGVGPKVSDCICLMALDKHDIVPVDTHVYQIAIRDYKFKGKKDLKTLNKETYGKIREHFKDIFGPYAGWAQSVLFAADLLDLNNGINVVELKAEVKTEIEKKPELSLESKALKEVLEVESGKKRRGGGLVPKLVKIPKTHPKK